MTKPRPAARRHPRPQPGEAARHAPAGGLTNHNYRCAPRTGLDVVVRRLRRLACSASTGAEHVNHPRRGGAVGAPVVDYLEGRGHLGRRVPPRLTGPMRTSAPNLPRLAAALRRLHAGPPFLGPVRHVRACASTSPSCRARDFQMPSGYLRARAPRPTRRDRCSRWPRAARALPQRPARRQRPRRRGDLRIIDYEYSGMNEPSFELGNAAAEAGLGPDALAERLPCLLRAGRRRARGGPSCGDGWPATAGRCGG